MSDVHVNTSWNIQPNGDFEYNGVLGCAGYDENNTRLFVSAQSPPNLAGNVTTPYCKGFHLTADYNGNLKSIPTDNESADLKRVRFTMSFAGSSYDLTDTRCYCQFANYFNVQIESWVFKHIATDATETAIASGTTLSQHDKIQIDFINDYGAGQFIFEFTYGTPLTDKMVDLGQFDPPVTHVGPQTLSPYLGCWIPYNSSYNPATTTPPNINIQGKICAVSNDPTYGHCAVMFADYDIQNNLNYMSYMHAKFSNNTVGYYGKVFTHIVDNKRYFVCAPESVVDERPWYQALYDYCNNAAGAYETVAEAVNYFTNGAGGLNTTDFNNYDGYVWSCCMFANIAGVYPSSMSTESEGGTEGDFDTTSDSLDTPDLPAEGVTTSPRAGDLYLMTESQFGIFQNAIYGSSVAQAIKALFNDVTNCILSVMTFPLPTSAYTTRFNSNVFAGGQDLGNSTECAVVKRYVEYDCGTVALNLFWDSALDLNPYTKLNIFIPAVGMRPIDADCCMGHTIGLKYHIDLLTGSCVAFVTIDGDVYQQHAGNIGQHMAFSGTNNGLIMSGILAGLAGNAANIAENQNPIAGAGDLVATTLNAFKVPRSVVGNFSGNTAQLAVQKPYIEIIRPIQQLPRDYTKFNAYPCYMTQQLINLSGWTEVQDIFIDDIDCTTEEREQLLTLLRTGVIL